MKDRLRMPHRPLASRQTLAGHAAGAVYLNSVVVWNATWSHAQQLASALAKNRQVYYFENVRLTGRPLSGLYEKTTYAVPPGVSILRDRRRFRRVSLSYLLYNQYVSIRTLFANRKQFQYFVTYNFVDVMGFLLAGALGKKRIFMFVDEYDALTSWPKLTPLFRILLRIHLRRADTVICTAKKLCERAEASNGNVLYLPNAADGTLAPPEGQAARRVRRGRAVGYIGSLGSWVDWELLLALAKEFPSCRFEIIGDGAVRGQLERARAEQGITNLTLHGYIPHSQIGPYLDSFDIALIPFVRNEITDSVSPIKLFEYWLFSLPVIARTTFELAAFQEALLLYETHAEASQCLRHLLDDPAEAERFGRAGRRLVETTYNWDHYEEVIRSSVLREN